MIRRTNEKTQMTSSITKNPLHSEAEGDSGALEGGDISSSSSSSGGGGGGLKRSLTFYDGFGCVVGIMIGSGIFSSPGLAMERAGSSGLVLFAWVAAGLLVSNTCLVYSELAAMIPTAGGDFDYLRRAYGDKAAFAFAWFNFWVL